MARLFRRGFLHGRLIHLQVGRSQLRVLLGTGSLEARLVARFCWYFAKTVSLWAWPVFGGDVNVRLEDLDVLFRLRELGFELLDLVFVGPAVQLEKGLAFLDGLVLLDQHRRHQSRFGQSRDQLDGVLDDLGIVRGRRHEAQPDQENQEHMHHEERTDQRPGMLNLSHLNLKKTSQMKTAKPNSNPSASTMIDSLVFGLRACPAGGVAASEACLGAGVCR